MNMTDWCKALVLTLPLFIFLAQCRPHEDIHVGSSRGRAALSLLGDRETCFLKHQNNRVVYCCRQHPTTCYETFQWCLAVCYNHNCKWSAAHPANDA
ncbi:hypothetical protein SORBI_3008G120450 [Sorghum bicolor]|uniref:Uncharacterized protein n=1 Tax=Sorghum bicolor TaxID=4558 RepID=A0A1Z5R661_SORBI|nr:hypothetical protein SORBI_3008G120450 [Sorghum bicolor]